VHLFVYIHLFICKTIALPFASDNSGNAELRPILSKGRVTTPKFKKKSIYILRQSDSDPQTMQGIDATQRHTAVACTERWPLPVQQPDGGGASLSSSHSHSILVHFVSVASSFGTCRHRARPLDSKTPFLSNCKVRRRMKRTKCKTTLQIGWRIFTWNAMQRPADELINLQLLSSSSMCLVRLMNYC